MRRAWLTQIGMMLLLAVAGCARHPAEQAAAPPVLVAASESPPEPTAPKRVGHGRRWAWHGHYGRRYVAHRGPDWTVACDDGPRGQSDCRIETVLRQAAPTAPAATISSTDGGKTWVVAAMPAPGAARLTVGQRPPVDADCSMPGNACAITGEAAAQLTQAFQSGARLNAEVLTTDGQLQRSVSLRGFSKELTRLRSRLPAESGPPPSPAQPPEAASPAKAPDGS